MADMIPCEHKVFRAYEVCDQCDVADAQIHWWRWPSEGAEERAGYYFGAFSMALAYFVSFRAGAITLGIFYVLRLACDYCDARSAEHVRLRKVLGQQQQVQHSPSQTNE